MTRFATFFSPRTRAVLLQAGLASLLLLVVVLLIGPGFGVLYENPLATLGVGLIGMGLCMEARRRGRAESVQVAPVPVGRDER